MAIERLWSGLVRVWGSQGHVCGSREGYVTKAASLREVAMNNLEIIVFTVLTAM